MAEELAKKLRDAISRLRRWDAGEAPSAIYTGPQDLFEQADNDAWDIARAYIRELDAEEQRKIAGAAAISVDWCKSVGLGPCGNLLGPFDLAIILGDKVLWVDDRTLQVSLNYEQLSTITTREQFLTLVRLLTPKSAATAQVVGASP